jgi:predicted alpha/beta-hydrolase family hydrolase
MLRVNHSQSVSTLWQSPPQATACFIFAHGAGAGMHHSFMDAFATGIAARGVATFRFQFPYMERGSRRPDPPPLCHATVRAAVAEAARRTDVPLFAGGRSFGGRMTSQAQAEQPLPSVKGIAFLGFPLHPAKRPSGDRAEHLSRIKVPMLFLQGTRDELAELELLEPLISRLGTRATLKLSQDANHAFHVPARSGRSDEQVLEGLIDSFTAWTGSVAAKPRG